MDNKMLISAVLSTALSTLTIHYGFFQGIAQLGFPFFNKITSYSSLCKALHKDIFYHLEWADRDNKHFMAGSFTCKGDMIMDNVVCNPLDKSFIFRIRITRFSCAAFNCRLFVSCDFIIKYP